VDASSAYFFLQDQCAGYTVGSGIDAGYPVGIADQFPALAAVGDGRFAQGVDAAWVRSAGGMVPPGGGYGKYVWYWNDMVSATQKIPQQAWFGTTAPSDYGGHGTEIFQFVRHQDGVYRGRPHMRNHEGTFAWLNHNPGNLTGVQGGLDLGQYPGRFNWHDFLIFPRYQAGYDAIAQFLLRSGYPAKTHGSPQWPAGKYRDLGITQAFHRYAPADDGNQPDVYGAAVAAAAGVPESTRISDLTPTQMRLMQDKIVEIEGSRPGLVLSPGSAEVPDVVRAALS
jgi:hypothetical protein